MVVNKNKTFNAWLTYQALYAHFTNSRKGGYDYFKYNGKLNMNEASMEKQFAKLANKRGDGQYTEQCLQLLEKPS